jgi:hypothetical protein
MKQMLKEIGVTPPALNVQLWRLPGTSGKQPSENFLYTFNFFDSLWQGSPSAIPSTDDAVFVLRFPTVLYPEDRVGEEIEVPEEID